ncbi:hypothetical protein TrispH2_002983 [Trichoplax sp. H2]|nr:hypothetical protein TrispH2_002983 [Trichoplax sp. H2]|eukprot:RDD45082.1 hypothetical protein TrispH2_002983 [Trichoplax sp. H2]
MVKESKGKKSLANGSETTDNSNSCKTEPNYMRLSEMRQCKSQELLAKLIPVDISYLNGTNNPYLNNVYDSLANSVDNPLPKNVDHSYANSKDNPFPKYTDHLYTNSINNPLPKDADHSYLNSINNPSNSMNNPLSK